MALLIKGETVFITGASSGIGKACAYQFAEKGARLILAARRIDRLHQLAQELKQLFNTEVLAVELDVRVKSQVMKFVETLPDQWANIDILVNNAGLARESKKIQEGNFDSWDVMIDTNVRGLLYVTRMILPKMLERQKGHVINVSSIAGHECYPLGNVYAATKHAVKAISKSMRIDLLGTPVRVSNISPGAVHTEFSEVRWNDKELSDAFYKQFHALSADDIADAIVYCATRPAHVNIDEMVILPVDQASANHIHKEASLIK